MKIFKENKQKGVLGILQVKELLMSIISQIYRYSISDSSLLLFHNFNFLGSDEDECEDCIEQVMKGYNLDLYEVLASERTLLFDVCKRKET